MAGVAVSLPSAPARPTRLRQLLGSLKQTNPSVRAGFAILAVWLVLVLLAPVLRPHGPNQVFEGSRLLPPSGQFPFGTDERGRDMLARVLDAFRYDMLLSLSAILIAIVGGLVVGAVAANSAGWADNALMRLMDVLFAFPSFVLALVLAGALGTSMWNLVVAIGVVFLPLYARLVRGSMLAEKERQYVEAAHGIGVSQRRLIWTHLLPNSIGPVITQSAMTVSWAIIVIAGISYLGFGIQPPTPEWGLMISEGAAYMTSGEWWVSFFPGIAILSIVAALMLIDDGLKAEA
ncbi:MAG: peptide transporter permease [Thermomicrobiales bacterium]|nr:peptide transporter permease [Thermomicrobiales bacterium]